MSTLECLNTMQRCSKIIRGDKCDGRTVCFYKYGRWQKERQCERGEREGDPPTLATVGAVQLNFTGYEAANGM